MIWELLLESRRRCWSGGQEQRKQGACRVEQAEIFHAKKALKDKLIYGILNKRQTKSEAVALL